MAPVADRLDLLEGTRSALSAVADGGSAYWCDVWRVFGDVVRHEIDDAVVVEEALQYSVRVSHLSGSCVIGLTRQLAVLDPAAEDDSALLACRGRLIYPDRECDTDLIWGVAAQWESFAAEVEAAFARTGISARQPASLDVWVGAL